MLLEKLRISKVIFDYLGSSFRSKNYSYPYVISKTCDHQIENVVALQRTTGSRHLVLFSLSLEIIC